MKQIVRYLVYGLSGACVGAPCRRLRDARKRLKTLQRAGNEYYIARETLEPVGRSPEWFGLEGK